MPLNGDWNGGGGMRNGFLVRILLNLLFCLLKWLTCFVFSGFQGLYRRKSEEFWTLRP